MRDVQRIALVHEQQTTILRKQISGLHLIEVSMPGGVQLSKRRFPRASLQIVLSGGYFEPSSDATRRSRSVHYHPADDVQDAVVAKPTTLFGVCFADDTHPLPTAQLDLHDSRLASCLLNARNEAHLDDEASPLALSGLAFELTALLLRQKTTVDTRPPKWLLAVARRLHEEPQRTFALGDLAHDAGVHPSHLARCFRRHFGCSVGEYHRARRLDLAQRLLAKEELTFEQVALRAGYYDSSHLRRALKLRPFAAASD